MGLTKDVKRGLTEWQLHDADYNVVAFIQMEDCADIVRWEGRYFHYDERCGQFLETVPVDVKSIDFKARAEEHFKK